MSKVINLTQHKSTANQNCLDLEGRDLDYLKELLTFNTLPDEKEILNRAKTLSALAWKQAYWNVIAENDHLSYLEDEDEILAYARGTKVMIGGAPYLMTALADELKKDGLTPVYSFTERKAVESVVDGEVRKTSIFSHVGWVKA